jgi:hypothetical protein
MRIRLSDPDLMPDLLAFLRKAQCVVEATGRDTVRASVPQALHDEQARLELALYLSVWQALHPGSDVNLCSQAD